MTKILLIGNGPTVLNKKLGPIIDSYDRVVRFNNFRIEGYEDHVGTKTDWVCYRACDDVKLVKPNTIHTAFLFITYCRWTNGMKRVAKMQQAWFGERAKVIDEVTCFQIAQQIGLKNDLTEWPSIGALAIGYFYKQGYEITTYGFGGDGDKHYFSKPPKDSCYHNWPKEREFIRSLKIQELA